ncbi:hypothetical protein EN751_28770 [Mesorhizobium sp. M4A.F.Ca.ET.029.04.2.1]|nr:hypothetical protein EN751_28770 [Mesorhizobium sp. M4A.F.Ca.ET.029.04.2.1]
MRRDITIATGKRSAREEVELRAYCRIVAAMTGLSRFERRVVVQVSRHSSERIVFDVGDAAAILLRDLHRQTEKRKAAMDARRQVLRG